jgi:RecA/RadA recombinase
MGRKKSSPEEPLLPGQDSMDVLFQAAQRVEKARWGDSQYVGGQEEVRIFCFELPLALQISFQLPGMPLGRVVFVVGPPGSCKSALTYEFARIYRMAGGGFSLIETEKKDSPILCKSISGYDSRRRSWNYCSTLEDWQSCLTGKLESMREAMDAHNPPRCYPWAFIVDSVAGVSTEKISGNVDKEGSASLNHPQSAVILSTYLKCLGHWFDNYPFNVFFVNHLKRQPDSYGHMSIRNLQGGYAPRFHESIELEMELVGKQFDIRSGVRYEEGKRLRISVAKNSLAAQGKPIEVDMKWFFENHPEHGRLQRTYFDWEAAAIEYLVKADLPRALRKELDSILDLNVIKKKNAEDLVWSEKLGISEDAPVSFRQAGKLIELDKNLKKALRSPLSIQDRFMFEVGKDLHEQRQEAIKKIVIIQDDGIIPMDFPDDPQSAIGKL